MAERRGDDVERYEQLRARVLAGDVAGFRLGLGVLHHRGVAGWLRAWSSPAAPTAATDSTIGAAGAATGRLRPGVPLGGSAVVPGGAAAEELVGVLAGMTLACLGGGDRW